jgi:hypothetical protein
MLLLAASVLNYIDRQSLSILASTIQRELRITDSGYATVLQYFLAFYTIMYVVSGRIVDRYGARMAETGLILWWCLSNMAASLVTGVASLGVVRRCGSRTAEWPPAAISCDFAHYGRLIDISHRLRRLCSRGDLTKSSIDQAVACPESAGRGACPSRIFGGARVRCLVTRIHCSRSAAAVVNRLGFAGVADGRTLR